MSYQSGDVLIAEFDGFVNDIFTVVSESTVNGYKSYIVYSRENDCSLNYTESYLKNMTISGEEFRNKYGIKKQNR